MYSSSFVYNLSLVRSYEHLSMRLYSVIRFVTPRVSSRTCLLNSRKGCFYLLIEREWLDSRVVNNCEAIKNKREITESNDSKE